MMTILSRHAIVNQRLVAGHRAVTQGHSGKELFAGAGRDENTFGLDGLGGRCGLSGDRGQSNGMRPGDSRRGLDIVDLVLAQQEAHALGELVGGLAAARDHALEIEANLAGFDAMFLGRTANRFHRLGRIEQRLGGNTSPVEADAAGQVAFDHGHAHFKLAGADRGDITAGTRADDHKIVA